MGLFNKNTIPEITEETTLEELEIIEARKRAQAVIQSKKDLARAERKEFLRTLTSPQHFITLIIFAVIGTVFMWLTTDNILWSVIIAATSAVFCTYYFSFVPSKLEAKQKDLAQLESYCLAVSFHMQTGKTVPETLETIVEDYDGMVGADIQHTLAHLKSTGELDFTHFSKYDFVALDIFHRNMMIAYQDGGDTGRLFKKPLSNMSTELVKRDELWRKNKFQRTQEYMALVIACAIPLTMRFSAADLHTEFTAMTPVAVGTMALVYLGCLFISFRIQKKAVDVSVRAGD